MTIANYAINSAHDNREAGFVAFVGYTVLRTTKRDKANESGINFRCQQRSPVVEHYFGEVTLREVISRRDSPLAEILVQSF